MLNESVYSLIPLQAAARQRPSKYHSKHNATVPPTCSTFGLSGTSKTLGNVAGVTQDAPAVHPAKKPCATFGRCVAQELSPKQFLHKSVKSAAPPNYDPVKFKRPVTQPVKAAVPKRDDKPVMGLTTDKNFVVSNAVETILAAPKRQPEPEARAIDKKDFGKVPTYIDRIKTELNTQHRLVEDSQRAEQAKAQAKIQPLPEDQLKTLQEGLKAKWATLNRQLQMMGFNKDSTKTQEKRKEALENSLRGIEAAMQKINKRIVYVFNDEE